MISNRYHFEEIDSTNKNAKDLALAGAEHGVLVTADVQQAGIGRRGRTWLSEKGTGIYMSMVLRPEIDTEKASTLTLVAAMAVQKAIEEMCGLNAQPKIKWPNDIVLNKKKICGILTELSLRGTDIDFVIVGIGINVNNQTFAEEIAQTASSLSLELGKEIDREMLISKVWKHFAVYYDLFLESGDLSLFKNEYEQSLVNKEQEVNVLDPLGEYTVIAKGITNTGSEKRYVSSGEVSVRGIYGYV